MEMWPWARLENKTWLAYGVNLSTQRDWILLVPVCLKLWLYSELIFRYPHSLLVFLSPVSLNFPRLLHYPLFLFSSLSPSTLSGCRRII